MKKTTLTTGKFLPLTRDNSKHLLLSVFIVTLVFVLYLPSLDHDFINWDDPLYVTKNPDIGNLSFSAIGTLFTTVVSSNWHPLTMLSLQLDYAIWGLNPRGYHLTNIALHTLNCLFVFFLSLKLVNSLNGFAKNATNNATLIAALSAIFFAIHPIHVESVAWISERKDLLYSFFFLLSISFYIRFTASHEKRKWPFYYISLALYWLSLMSKPMAVTLPLILVIIDVYPLSKIKLPSSPRSVFTLLIDKIPYFILAFLASMATIWAQQSGGAIKSVTTISVLTRLAVAIRAYIFYIIKIILPFDLAPFYPHPAISNFDVPNIHYAAYFTVFLVITALCVWTFRTKPVFTALWSNYVITLAPVIGIIHVGGQAAADRYMYMASLSPFLLISLGITVLITRLPKLSYRVPIVIFLICITAFQIVQTRKQISIWRDSIALWNYEISVFPNEEALPYYNRGKAWDLMGKLNLALKDYDQAISINNYHTDAYIGRGIISGKLGKYGQALLDMSKAIELDPSHEKAYSNRGSVYHYLRQYDLAERDYLKAIELNPADPVAYNNIAILYNEQGKFDKAAVYGQKAKKLSQMDFK
jgi:hypothetical protein